MNTIMGSDINGHCFQNQCTISAAYFKKIFNANYVLNIRSTSITKNDPKANSMSRGTEALKGHRVVWKIEICYLIRMTYEWKPMSSGWHNNIVVTHPDEIPISAKSPGWHTVYDMSSGWHTAVSKSHPDEIRPGANSSGWLRVQMTLCHPDDIGEYRKSSGWHSSVSISHPDDNLPISKSSGWLRKQHIYLIRMT